MPYQPDSEAVFYQPRGRPPRPLSPAPAGVLHLISHPRLAWSARRSLAVGITPLCRPSIPPTPCAAALSSARAAAARLRCVRLGLKVWVARNSASACCRCSSRTWAARSFFTSSLRGLPCRRGWKQHDQAPISCFGRLSHAAGPGIYAPPKRSRRKPLNAEGTGSVLHRCAQQLTDHLVNEMPLP